MRVILAERLFADDANTAMMIAILHHGVSGRHAVQTDPMPVLNSAAEGNHWVWPSEIQNWLAQQSQAVRETVELCINQALTLQADQLPARTLVVVEAAGDELFEVSEAWVPLPRAKQLLEMALKVMVENAGNDRAFLLAFAPDEHATALRNAEDGGWLEFVNGGGITDARNQVEALNPQKPRRFRHFVLFDSDSASPNQPSSDARKLKRECEAANIPFHALRRRAAENYLPLPALEQWANSPGHAPNLDAGQRAPRVRALAKLKPDLRYHYNFKGGFAADNRMQWSQERDEARTRFLADLQPALRTDLSSGIHKDIADLYANRRYTMNRHWFLNEDSDREIAEAPQSLAGSVSTCWHRPMN